MKQNRPNNFQKSVSFYKNKFKNVRNWLIITILASGIVDLNKFIFSFFLMRFDIQKTVLPCAIRNKAPPKNCINAVKTTLKKAVKI